MADTKITGLQTPQVTTNPATDVLPIVNIADNSMAASGSTRKITVNQLLGAGGTATLASATISGDLTVRTNKLKVDATGVAIGATSAAYLLDVRGTDTTNALIAGTTKGIRFVASASTSSIVGVDNTGAASYQPLSIGGSALDFSLSGSTAMTLNANGLGIGVTPSAWDSGFQVIENSGGSLWSGSTGAVRLSQNVYYATGLKYKYALAASQYVQTSGQHQWFNAPSGTAGQTTTVTSGNSYTITAAGGTNYTTFGAANNNVGTTFTATSSGTGNGGGVTQNITFTQAMTLAANGQLLLGTSTTDGAIDIGMVLNKPSATGFVGNSYQLNGSSKAFTYISSAAGAFRVDTVTGYTINMVSATNGVYLANGGTSWTALSDERFKDIIEPISNAVAKVGSIRSVIGKFKTESEGTRRSFLIAQDVQAVLPEAVDASNPEKLGVSYTEVIPLLVAAIKELTAEVNALKNA